MFLEHSGGEAAGLGDAGDRSVGPWRRSAPGWPVKWAASVCKRAAGLPLGAGLEGLRRTDVAGAAGAGLVSEGATASTAGRTGWARATFGRNGRDFRCGSSGSDWLGKGSPAMSVGLAGGNIRIAMSSNSVVTWPKHFVRRLQRLVGGAGLFRLDLHRLRLSRTVLIRHGFGRRDSWNRHAINHLDSRFRWLGCRLSGRFFDARGFLLYQIVVQSRESFERCPRAIAVCGRRWIERCLSVDRRHTIRTVVVAARQHHDAGIFGWKIDGGGR